MSGNGNGLAPATEDDYAGPMFERTPPHDLAAEQSVLGGMMLSKAAIGDVLRVLKGPAEFYRPAHQLVYEAITALYGRKEPTDIVAVTAELARAGDLGRMGGDTYLHTCVHSVPTAANAGYYARIVRGLAILRRVVEVSTRAAQTAYAAEGDAEDLAARAAADMSAILAGRISDDVESFGVLLAREMDRIDRPPAQSPRLSTGFADLDAVLAGGLGAGQLCLIAARPAIGKSTLAMDFARWVGLDRPRFPARHVLFISCEMPKDEVMSRAISAESRVGLAKIREGGPAVGADDWGRITNAAARMMEGLIWIIQATGLTLADVHAAFAEREREGCRPAIIIVDYVQLMRATGRFGNREQEMASVFRGLKDLAMLLGVPVVALSQLNRGPEQRSDKRPQLSDLRETGEAEQAADIVILLHREDAHEPMSPRAGEADFIVAKNRNGPTATITVAFQGHYSRFVDMAPIDTNAAQASTPDHPRSWPGARDSG